MPSLFYTLALLACPVSMGLMMFMMMRGQHSGPAAPAADAADRSEVEALRAEVEALKAHRVDGGGTDHRGVGGPAPYLPSNTSDRSIA